MRYIVKMGVIRGNDEYAYSVWIETEYGAVIDMWSNYLVTCEIKEVYSSMISELYRKFPRILKEDSDVTIYVDDEELTEYVHELLKVGIDNILREIVGESIPYKIQINVEGRVFDKDDRVYSLARMALKIKGRYPPIL